MVLQNDKNMEIVKSYSQSTLSLFLFHFIHINQGTRVMFTMYRLHLLRLLPNVPTLLSCCGLTKPNRALRTLQNANFDYRFYKNKIKINAYSFKWK